MNSRKPLLMLAVLLGLGAYIYFIDFAKQQEEEDSKKLLQFDPEAVTSVSLTYPDSELQLTKDGETWKITKPIEAKADTSAVDSLVKAVNNAEVSRTLEDLQEDMSLYGLNEPMVKVQLTLTDGSQLPQITIGKDTPVGHSVYVQRASEEAVLLTPQVFRLGMTKETKDLRDKTVVAFEKENVTQIEVRRLVEAPEPSEAVEDEKTSESVEPSETPDYPVEVAEATEVEEQDTGQATEQDTTVVLRRAAEGWTLDTPLSAQADDATVNTFLSSLSGMRAQDFIEEPLLELKEFGLDPPQLSVVLTLGEDGEQKKVLVGSERSADQGAKQRHVKREDAETLYLVGDWTFRDLNKTANDFRDKTVARFDRDAVVRVEVKRQDGHGFFITQAQADSAEGAEGQETKWQIDVTQEGTLKESALDDFVKDMHELKGFEIVADSPDDTSSYGLQEPLVTIRAYDAAEERLAGMIIGQTTQDDTTKIFAMAEDGQTVFGVRDYVFDRLNKKPADFWEKPIEETEETADSEAATEDELEEEQM